MSREERKEESDRIGVADAYIAKAQIVLEYAPELADSVIAGAPARWSLRRSAF